MVMISSVGTDGIPQDVKDQKEAAGKLLENFEAGQPGSELAPDEPYRGTPSGEPAPGSLEDFKQQVADLTRALTDLQASISDENSETWRHKYDVINGKYKAEIQPAAARIRELEETIVQLQQDMGREARIPVSAEERGLADDLGVDEETFVRMKKVFQPQAETSAEPAAQPSASRTAYFALLDAKARGWRETMNTEGFRLFLKQNPTAYNALVAADNALDAEGTAGVYNTFFQTSRRRGGREAAPSSSRGGGGFSSEDSQAWSLEEIQKFEKDVATGKIKMGSQEYKDLKASRDKFLESIGM
jgi:hypothetical protein